MSDATLSRYGQLSMRTRALLDALDVDWTEAPKDPVLAAAIDLLEQTERRLSLYVSAMPSAGSSPPSRTELQQLWREAASLTPDHGAAPGPAQSPATDI